MNKFIIFEDSDEIIVKENAEEILKELKRKSNCERQRAYYQRQKGLKKKNRKIKEKVPLSNAERQRRYRQRNAEKSYQNMKRQKLDSNEENVMQCSAVKKIENVTLQENQFHSQQLEIYEQRNECITPDVILHRNTGIPGDGNCLFHSLISVLQLPIESCVLRNQLRDSPYISSCHNPQEAYNILSSTNDYGDLDCLFLFSKMYSQNVCVHYCFYNVTTKNQDTIFCHFKANDAQNWIHLHLREQHFTPFYEVSYSLDTIQDTTQNEVHVDANIKLLRDYYDEDPTEDNNQKNKIEIYIEDLGENVMHFIVDGSAIVYTNYRKHSTSHIDFYKDFTSNSFGHSCIICDRLCWKRDMKMSTSKHEGILKKILQNYTPGEIVQVCPTCYTSLEKVRIPLMSTYNGFAYPKIPSHLPTLNLIEQRLISPIIPFMQIRRLRHVNGQYGIYGQIINIPVEVNTMVKQLPRNIEDDYCLYVHLKKEFIHKTSYVSGLINNSHIKEWLSYLLSTPLYMYHDIKIDESFFTGNERTSHLNMDDISEHVPIEDNLVAQQQTLLWDDDYFLSLAPGEYNRPVSILMDEHAEELSFPTIYGGQFRTYRDGITVTPFTQASSELRRTDRRATDPQHLLYIAAKIMRLRVSGCVNVAYKHVGQGTSITKETIQSEEFINNCLETNLVFLRYIPNSAWFWSDSKKDLFAMIRQLGPPTAFMTLSSNETGWENLLKLLYQLRNDGAEISDECLSEMSYVHKAQLVNEDAVTCALYFNKMINCLLKILQSKKRSPFDKYRVVHYFKRIEFQHGGSPHAHILLWLENVPEDLLSNDPEVIKLIDELVSVSASEASGNIELVTHKHTFQCYKKINHNKKLECRFGAPFMPTKKTIYLIPMKDTHPVYSEALYKEYKEQYKFIRNNLENVDYTNFDEFYSHNDIISDDHYYDIIRAGINRPKLFYKRTPAEKWHNTFNPFVLHHLKSNMDFQIILDEYACATYVVEYVNNHNRGISNLQRQIIDIMDNHPEFDIVDITKKMSIDILQSVEMPAQEAAWYLLREPIAKSSVVTVNIPTVFPTERARIRKSMKELEAIDNDYMNVWKENWFDKYEKRPEELRDVTLAQFLANYYVNKKGTYSKRDTARIIRYRNYDMADNYNDYRREMVLLHVPFQSEENEIIAENKFIQIYEDNKNTILERSKEFESNLDIEKTLEICRQLCRENNGAEQEDEELLGAVDTSHERDDTYDLMLRDPTNEIQCQKTWYRWIANAKNKQKRVIELLKNNGGGTAETPLTELDKRIVSIVNRVQKGSRYSSSKSIDKLSGIQRNPQNIPTLHGHDVVPYVDYVQPSTSTVSPLCGSYKGKKSKVAVKIDRTSKLNPIQAVNIDDDDSASKTDSALDCPSKSEEQLLIETALSTVCRLCMRGRGSLDLTEPLEENKTLADMLSDCYGITLSCMSEAGRSRLACSECAASLQRASAFKRRVLLAEHVFAEHCRQPQTDDHDGNSKGNDSITEIKEKTSTLPPVVSRAAKRPNRRDTGAKSSKVTRQSDKNIVILQNKKNIIDSGSSDSDTTNKADKHKDIDDTIGNYGENISDIMETDGNYVDDIGNCTENICDVMETDGNKVDDVIGNDRTNIGDNIENHGNNIDVRKAVQNSSITRNFGNQYVFDVVSSEPEYILPNSTQINSDIYSMTIKEEIKVEVEDECEKYESSSDDSDDEE